MQLDDDQTHKLLIALTKSVQSQHDLVQTVKNAEKDKLDLILDRIEKNTKAGEEWKFAFIVFACFMIVLVTVFLGFLNS